MAHKEWRCHYFTNISLYLHCSGLNFFKKMRHSMLYRTIWKETFLGNSLKIIFDQHCRAWKSTTFKVLCLVFTILCDPFIRCKKNSDTPFCSPWKVVSVRAYYFLRVVNISKQNPLFFSFNSCFEDLRVRLVVIFF
jgi:hypothetical protein